MVAFTLLGHPESDAALQALAGLERRYARQGIVFLNLNISPEDSLFDVAQDAMWRKATFPFGKDMDRCMEQALGVRAPGTVALLDSELSPLYLGDASGLISPLQALLSGSMELPLAQATPQPASKESAPSGAQPPTYANLAPLVSQNCMPCHSGSGVGPMALNSYTALSNRSAMVAEVLAEERMPPWYAHGGDLPFTNAPTLTRTDRRLFKHWHDAGKPEGATVAEPAPAPAIAFTPDIKITASAPTELPAFGYIEYVEIWLPVAVDEDVWIQGLRIVPSNSRVLHHAALVALAPEESTETMGRALAFTAPGMPPFTFPDGAAARIPKGSRLLFRLYYVTTGKPEQDTISVELMFPKGPVMQEVYTVITSKRGFTIPAHAAQHELTHEATLDRTLSVLGVSTHMHLRGKYARMTAVQPDATEIDLLTVPAWNFNWQLVYYVQPGTTVLPAGTILRLTAGFDNSRFNPYNPAPQKEVRHGAQTTDEMMEGILLAVDPSEKLNLVVNPEQQRAALRKADVPAPTPLTLR